MRFLWFTAALVAGCVGAPMGSELRTRTTLNPDIESKRAGIPNKGNVDPVNDGDVTNNISFLRLC
ncbi:hypothetical protein N7541_008788 [Penicillium brevicompactum]|uniref:RxLR effector protein n=1 Tax=Penicillium brevicompactum TaxID=5074 RepID=A0A9W9QV84_PENBR|nr:hypothetical protein N7541_008788 [Penicillium brevicompactum]